MILFWLILITIINIALFLYHFIEEDSKLDKIGWFMMLVILLLLITNPIKQELNDRDDCVTFYNEFGENSHIKFNFLERCEFSDDLIADLTKDLKGGDINVWENLSFSLY